MSSSQKHSPPTRKPAAPGASVAHPEHGREARTRAPGGNRTTIVAAIDVGYKNTLYIRGDGPGLTWDWGMAMDCVADDRWIVTIHDATAPIVFKFLLNDTVWCHDPDFAVQPGAYLTITPTF